VRGPAGLWLWLGAVGVRPAGRKAHQRQPPHGHRPTVPRRGRSLPALSTNGNRPESSAVVYRTAQSD
jgi:hypothetical protein